MSTIEQQIQNAKPAIESVLASYHDCGPFDGGCLIFANALKIKHGGELVRICSNIGQGQTEHYGLLADGVIYDADGGASSPEAWIDRFQTNEMIRGRDLYFAIGEDANSDCVDDAKTSEVISLLFDAYSRADLSITSIAIYKDYLKNAIDAVYSAANNAIVSPMGFIIEDSMCDCGEIETSEVADIIDEAAQHFGDVGSENYQYVVNALCEAVTKHFAHKD